MVRKFFREYILQLVVGLTVTGTVTVVAVIGKYWTWPNAVLGGVLLLCGILYLMDRLGIGPSTKTRVRDWLDSTGFGIQTVQDTNEFHFAMVDNIGLRTDILQNKSGDPVVIISAGHSVSPQRLDVFNFFTKDLQDRFWKNIRLELLRYGVSFSNLKLDGDGVSFSENVVVSSQSSGTEFLQRVLYVRSAGRLYWELLSVLDRPTTEISVKTGTAPTQPTIQPMSTPGPLPSLP